MLAAPAAHHPPPSPCACTTLCRYGPQGTTSWGGNILLGDDGVYHLYVSAMGGGEGLSSWGSNSQIDHATAADPMDVFKKADTALGREASTQASHSMLQQPV